MLPNYKEESLDELENDHLCESFPHIDLDIYCVNTGTGDLSGIGAHLCGRYWINCVNSEKWSRADFDEWFEKQTAEIKAYATELEGQTSLFDESTLESLCPERFECAE
jgi:hypothetical protein